MSPSQIHPLTEASPRFQVPWVYCEMLREALKLGVHSFVAKQWEENNNGATTRLLVGTTAKLEG